MSSAPLTRRASLPTCFGCARYRFSFRCTSWKRMNEVLAASSLHTHTRMASTLPPPPPLPPPPFGKRAAHLPPPPPLKTMSFSSRGAAAVMPWKTPQEVLSFFMDYIPTFYVSLQSVAAVLPEDTRQYFTGRGRLQSFLRRYPFFFELRAHDVASRVEVRLHRDAHHPRYGAADNKYTMVDVGHSTSYVAKPECIINTDSIENVAGSVALKPPSPPPSVRVEMEERVPVLERLKTLVPLAWTPLEEVEEGLPEDILFHPYFDCQGGFASIATKFPEHFQIADGNVRRRQQHLAPMALNDFDLTNSPMPEVAALIRAEVCSAEVPFWVSLTSLYEQLSREQKKQIKAEHRSFAGFLRAHGRAVAVSQDMLQVSKWIPPPPSASEKASAAPSATREAIAGCSSSVGNGTLPIPTRLQIVNGLYDRLVPQRSYTMEEVIALLPSNALAAQIPTKNLLGWLSSSYPGYFVMVGTPEDGPSCRLRRSSSRAPLDMALAVYQHMPAESDGVDCNVLLTSLSASQQMYVRAVGGMAQLAALLPDWLEVVPSKTGDADGGQIHRCQAMDALQLAIRTEKAKTQLREGRRKRELMEEIADLPPRAMDAARDGEDGA